MRKKISLILGILLIVISIVSCGGNNGKIKIRLNEVTHSIFYAPQYLAIALGYFEEYNIELELTDGSGADKSMPAVLSGGADIGLMGPEAAIYVHIQGNNDPPIVFGQLTKRDGTFLMGRTPLAEGATFDYNSLKGKTIISGRTGGMPAMTFEYTLNSKGLYDGVDVTLDGSVSFPAMAPTFIGGTGDFVTLFEPVASTLAAEGVGYILTSIGKDSGEVPYTAYIAKRSFLNNNKETVLNFLKAIIKAQEQIELLPVHDVAVAIQKYFATSSIEQIEAAVKSYKEIDAWMKTPAMEESSFTRLQDILENAGELSKRVDFKDLIDNSFANQALTEYKAK